MSEDLSPEYIESLRRLSGAEKLQIAFSLYWEARRLKEAAVRDQHPDWPEERVQQEVKEIFLKSST